MGYRPIRLVRNEADLWENDGRGYEIDRGTVYFTTGGGELTLEEIEKETSKRSANAK